MDSEFSDEVPPPFNGKTDDFLKWERKYRLWKNITDVDKTKLGSLVVLNLDDDTLLEFRRSWRFLTGAGVLDHIFDVFI